MSQHCRCAPGQGPSAFLCALTPEIREREREREREEERERKREKAAHCLSFEISCLGRVRRSLARKKGTCILVLNAYFIVTAVVGYLVLGGEKRKKERQA